MTRFWISLLKNGFVLILFIISSNIGHSQEKVTYLECTGRSLDLGTGKSRDIKYVYSLASNILTKLSVDDSSLAIDMKHECTVNPYRYYCERSDFGTIWAVKLDRNNGDFTETILTDGSNPSPSSPSNTAQIHDTTTGQCIKIDVPKSNF